MYVNRSIASYGMVILGIILLSSGCTVDPDDTFEDLFCTASGETAMVGGTWTIEGDGDRSECGVDWMNTKSLSLSASEFVIAQDGSRLSYVSAPLAAGSSEPFVTGAVDGQCVELRIIQSTDQGTVDMTFEGRIGGAGQVSGRVTGQGPGSCRLSGQFTATVECCAGSGPTAPDPDATDSSDAPDGTSDSDADWGEYDVDHENPFGCRAAEGAPPSAPWLVAAAVWATLARRRRRRATSAAGEPSGV